AFATVGENQNHILGVHHAQVAVHRAGRVERVGAGTRRTECPGQLFADIRRLTGPGDAQAARASPGKGLQQPCRSQKRFIEQRGPFGPNNLPGRGESNGWARARCRKPNLKCHLRLHAEVTSVSSPVSPNDYSQCPANCNRTCRSAVASSSAVVPAAVTLSER